MGTITMATIGKIIVGIAVWVNLSGPGSNLYAQQVGVNWLSFAQLEETMRVKPKKILVQVYTDWCSYCKLVERKTFNNPEVVQYLNEHFYVVGLNAEGEQTIRFAGQLFGFNATGNGTGIHSLALALAGQKGQVAYPSMVVLDEHYTIVNQQTGFVSPKQLLGWLRQVQFSKNE